jgi:hypothetical protein
MGEVKQVGKLSNNFQPKGDALISAGDIDAAAQASTDSAAANDGTLEASAALSRAHRFLAKN